ncbi:MAG: hypothetical protein D6790_10765 [Caldilineae bacterium]|nr:MAG: hypothetical protein D6790_10765 [Caldilineae bacterium]
MNGYGSRRRFTLMAMLVLGGALAGMLADRACAQWPDGEEVAETYHNLQVPAQVTNSDMFGLIRDYGEVCVYCHTPHGGSTERVLWNRPLPSGPYRMYDEPLDMLADPQPTGNSLACLSCHDGTIGLDEIVNLPNGYDGPGPSATSIEECDGCHSGGSPPGGHDFEGVWFDTDLRKQHPISLLYDPARDPGFRSIAEVEAAGLKLFEGKVQCMTCHEPHSERFPPFLRIANSAGSLCLACHRTQPAEETAHFW